MNDSVRWLVLQFYARTYAACFLEHISIYLSIYPYRSTAASIHLSISISLEGDRGTNAAPYAAVCSKACGRNQCVPTVRTDRQTDGHELRIAAGVFLLSYIDSLTHFYPYFPTWYTILCSSLGIVQRKKRRKKGAAIDHSLLLLFVYYI